MLWGQEQIPTFTAMIEETIAYRNVTAVLGMNEYVFYHCLTAFIDKRIADLKKQVNRI
jgi:hypothetical protein